MIFKKLIEGEILEFNILALKKRDKISFYYLLVKRINHLIYKKFQRLILKPKLRNILKKIEIFFFKKNFEIPKLQDSDLIKKKRKSQKKQFCVF